MSLGLLRNYFKWINRPYYVRYKLGYLFVCWFFQRVLRIHSEIPFLIHFTNKVQGFERIEMEDEVVKANFLSSGGTYITVFDGTTLKIGKGTIWAYNICIQTGNHTPGSLSEYDVASVEIGSNCWIGNGAAILAGVTLGNNVIVGANAVVTKSFPDNVIIGGVPATIIKEISVREV